MKYAICTLGCKVNQFETQAIETMLSELGYEPSQDGGADVVIVNTCAVTAESGRKSRQAIRRLKSQNPGALTAVCGCFSQVEPKDIEALGADIVFGSGRKREFVEAIDKALRGGEGECEIDDPFRRRSFETLPAGALEGRTRAYMKIEDGCDNFCTYCVIPYARGRVLSMPLADAAEQAGRLAGEGYAEIIVTGIEIASYGKDFHDGTKLIDVIETISKNASNSRIRLGSIEPTVITENFVMRLKRCGNVCRHFHLSLQSGCDKTLKNMHRKYNTADFYEKVCLLRSEFPGCGLTADLIAGFPGETEEDHAATLEFIKKCGFSDMHVFPYSIRPGTKAAAMPQQLTHAVKDARARQAQEAADEMRAAFLRSCIGKKLPVLFEAEHGGLWQGHADNYCLVAASGSNLHGKMKNVLIESADGEKLVGKIVDFGE